MRLVTLAIAQAFDFATFSVMIGAHGVGAEANPLVKSLFLNLGTPAVVVAKIALVTLIGALVVAAALRGGQGRWALVGGMRALGSWGGPRVGAAGRGGAQGRWALVGGMPLALGIAAGLIGGITNAAVILPH